MTEEARFIQDFARVFPATEPMDNDTRVTMSHCALAILFATVVGKNSFIDAIDMARITQDGPLSVVPSDVWNKAFEMLEVNAHFDSIEFLDGKRWFATQSGVDAEMTGWFDRHAYRITGAVPVEYTLKQIRRDWFQRQAGYLELLAWLVRGNRTVSPLFTALIDPISPLPLTCPPLRRSLTTDSLDAMLRVSRPNSPVTSFQPQ